MSILKIFVEKCKLEAWMQAVFPAYSLYRFERILFRENEEKSTRASKVKCEWLMCKISQVQKIKRSRRRIHFVCVEKNLDVKKVFSFFSLFGRPRVKTRNIQYNHCKSNQWIYFDIFIRFRLPASLSFHPLFKWIGHSGINTFYRILNEAEHRLNGILLR